MKSTAVVVREPGKVVLEHRTLEAPGPGEVLIETHYSALSPGTERHVMQGQTWPLPVAIGYSLTGRIAAVGSEVSAFQVGDSVVAVAPHASHVVIDQRAVLHAPQGLDLEQAAFFVLAHTALYGIRQARLQLGETVAVIGQGIVGLLAARMAQLAGGLPVIAIDVDERRLEFSRRLGIHETVNGVDVARLNAVVSQLPEGSVSVVIEATGLPVALKQALEIVGERGRIVLLGMSDGAETTSFPQPLSMKGAALIGGYVNSKPWTLSRTDIQVTNWPPSVASGARPYAGPGLWTSTDDIRVILELIKYGSLDLRPLITHRFTVEQVPMAYQQVLEQDPALIGGVIHWQGLQRK